MKGKRGKKEEWEGEEKWQICNKQKKAGLKKTEQQ